MELIITVKDNVVIGFEWCGEVSPESLEAAGAGEDGSSIAAKVMGVNDCMSTCGSDEINDSGQVSEIGGVEGSGHVAWGDTFHQDGDSKNVHSLVHEDLNGTGVRPCVICAENTGNIGVAEFSTGFVGSNPFERASGCGGCGA